MKISVSTLGLYPAKIENVLDFVTKLNLDYLEIVKEYPYHDLTENDFASHDLKLSVHAPMSNINIASHIDKIREASVSEMIEAFRKANGWGAKRVVVHPGSIPIMALKYPEKILEYAKKSLIECKKQSEEYDVMMCVENMPLMDGLLYSNIEALFELSEEIDTNITLDVGHAHNNHFTVQEMLNSDRIRHIHIHDNDTSWDLHDALGTHNFDFTELFRQLENKKYDDICVIEVNTKNEILKSIDYLKSIKIL